MSSFRSLNNVCGENGSEHRRARHGRRLFVAATVVALAMFGVVVAPGSAHAASCMSFPCAFSSNPTWESNTPDKAIDLNTSTWWQTVSATTTPTITVDLGVSTSLSAARTQWVSGFAASSYLIQTSADGTTWTTQLTITGNTNSDRTDGFPVVSARYLQLVVTPYTPPPTPYANFALTELGWDNHGVSFPLATASGPSWQNNTPDKAVDLNTSTWWQPIGTTSTPTLIVNLGTSTRLSAIRTQWLSGYAASNYQIQTSPDGVTWTTQATVTGNAPDSVDHTYFFAALNAQYLQLVVTPYTPPGTPYAFVALTELGWDNHGVSFTYPYAYSSNPTWASNTPDKAIDGNTATWWQTVSATTTPTITVNLGTSTTLTAARTQWLSGYAASSYQIQTSPDGITWTTQLNIIGNTNTDRSDAFAPVNAQYLQLVVTPYSPPGMPYANLALTELGWNGHGANFPLAYSTNPTWENNTPDKAIDGNTATWWQPISATTTPTITVNLGTTTTLTAFRTQWYPGFAASSYQIQTSPDGVNWTTQLSVTGNTSADRSDAFAPLNAQYLQLVVTPYTPPGTPYANFALTELSWNGHGVNFPLAYSSNPTWRTNTPDKAIDGNTATWWQTIDATATPTITVNLGVSTTLSAARTQWYPGFAASNYQIRTSPDGIVWTTRLTVTGNTSTDRTDTFAAVNAQYLQLVIIPYTPNGITGYADFALTELGWNGHGV
jgi:hypothetical protein